MARLERLRETAERAYSGWRAEFQRRMTAVRELLAEREAQGASGGDSGSSPRVERLVAGGSRAEVEALIQELRAAADWGELGRARGVLGGRAG